MAIEGNVHYMTVYQCGHLIHEVITDKSTTERQNRVTYINDKTTLCCKCRGVHYVDCTHPFDNTEPKRRDVE